MTSTGQDGEELVTDEMVAKATVALREWVNIPYMVHAAEGVLAAVAPDIAAQVRRECDRDRDELGRDWARRLDEVAAERDEAVARTRRECAEELHAADTWDEVWELTHRWSKNGGPAGS